MTLAYIDSFSGLVACKVSEITRDEITVQVTARANRAYRCGAIVTLAHSQIVPRDKVIKRGAMSGPRILPYSWSVHA